MSFTSLQAKLAEAPHEGSHWRQVADLLVAGDAAIAADRLGEMTYWLNEADARLLAANQLAEQGRDEEAREQLEKALPFYRSIGATRFLGEAETLLRPHGEPGTGLDTDLSAPERT